MRDADVRTADADSLLSGALVQVTVALPAPLRTPRSSRLLVQVGCLGVVTASSLVPVSPRTAILAAQVAAALIVSLIVRALWPGDSPTSRILQVWGVGALVSVAAVMWLHGIHSMDLERAQLGAVLALLGLVFLGRMGDAYRAAGTRLDAILATLPPPTQDAGSFTPSQRQRWR